MMASSSAESTVSSWRPFGVVGSSARSLSPFFGTVLWLTPYRAASGLSYSIDCIRRLCSGVNLVPASLHLLGRLINKSFLAPIRLLGGAIVITSSREPVVRHQWLPFEACVSATGLQMRGGASDGSGRRTKAR